MAEILVKGIDSVHSDAAIDRRGCYKRGMFVVAMPDGHEWGAAERMPAFCILKFPGVSVAAVTKYLTPELADAPESDAPMHAHYRRRRWRIRWDDLPAAAKNKILANGCLVIKAGGYAGTYDYTWAQVKGYFRDLKTGLDETDNL